VVAPLAAPALPEVAPATEPMPVASGPVGFSTASRLRA